MGFSVPDISAFAPLKMDQAINVKRKRPSIRRTTRLFFFTYSPISFINFLEASKERQINKQKEKKAPSKLFGTRPKFSEIQKIYAQSNNPNTLLILKPRSTKNGKILNVRGKEIQPRMRKTRYQIIT